MSQQTPNDKDWDRLGVWCIMENQDGAQERRKEGIEFSFCLLI